MQDIWHIRAEIAVQPKDFPSGNTAEFMNIVTWADSGEDAATKIAAYFESFNWQIVEVLESKIVTLEGLYENDEFQDMIEAPVQTRRQYSAELSMVINSTRLCSQENTK